MRTIVHTTLLLLFSLCAMAQDQTTLDEEEWERLTEDVDYVEQQREISGFKWPKLGLGIDSTVVQYIFFGLILAVLIYVLIKYVMALQNAGAKDDDDVGIAVENLEEAEADPMKADLEGLIQKLIGHADYRGATRAYFLLVLQRLHRQKLIDWQKPKTNFDYVREVRTQPFHGDFVALTGVFEEVWYGEHPLSAQRFDQSEQQFKRLIAQLRHE